MSEAREGSVCVKELAWRDLKGLAGSRRGRMRLLKSPLQNRVPGFRSKLESPSTGSVLREARYSTQLD